MHSKTFFIFFFFCFLFGQSSQAQDCVQNRLKLKNLDQLPSNVTRYSFSGGSNSSSATVSITKTGEGRDLSAYETNGIWIGKDKTGSNYSDITLTFSKPITSLSFALGFLNNDKSSELVENFMLKNEQQEEVTTSAEWKWYTGPSSKVKGSEPGATVFDRATRTLRANNGKCCEAASGRLVITDAAPFTSISFRHREVAGLANGVVLSGDIFFCVVKEVPKKEKPPVPPVVKTPPPKTTKPTPQPPSSLPTPVLSDQQINTTGQTIQLNGVLFKQSVPELLPESYLELDTLAEILTHRPRLLIELQGHTDNQGDPALNQQLSEQRAGVVKQYLVTKGIAAERIAVKGFGGSKPIFPNDTEAQRKMNRRVELVILKM